jgi:hypothetical protein
MKSALLGVSVTVSMILPLCKSNPASNDTVPSRWYS